MVSEDILPKSNPIDLAFDLVNRFYIIYNFILKKKMNLTLQSGIQRILSINGEDLLESGQ
ncbi:MAG: hypothetical protein HeimC3_31920 [Candidatus Heimdallarchaeota archaeon LC_3]|nr:MAG: hypothetical protein HeimC3_31920 [Candidatus Heimdallarchaeota archaeon LC_3]